MEMNDNHVEYHTVGEFLEFCVNGPGGKAGGERNVLQRLGALLTLLVGERRPVRVLMVSDETQMIIHKKPDGGLSAVGGNSVYTYFEPGCPEYTLLEAGIKADTPKLLEAMKLVGEPLPLLWTADFIPKDAEDGTPGVTEYVVGEFNCSCVGVSKFQAVCGGDKTLADVPDEDYFDASKLTDLMGRKAVEMVSKKKRGML
ncbi:MAG: hypothetical protein SGPRY_001818 [Prymnesium sp.]